MSAIPVRPGILEAALRRDRLVVTAGLLALAGLAWAYIAHLAAMMPDHSAMMMPQARSWGVAETASLAIMWIVMMVAMMVPSAAPMILLFAGVSRRRRAQGIAATPVSVFVLGYLLAWTGYSVLAALSQSALHSAGLLSPAMASDSALLTGGLLILAGLYQWLPIKDACLSHCRSPLGFLSTYWREGVSGALLMGLRHGSFCVGCCWALMALLFVVGVMNLLWVAGIAGLVLLEKAAPAGVRVGKFAGSAFVAWGGWMLITRLT